MYAVVAATLMSMLGVACGSGTEQVATPPTVAPSMPTTLLSPAATSTTVSPIMGVESFSVGAAGHQEGSLSYPQTPPVGGPHNRSWTSCAFYDRAIPTEMGVHSLEHGAIWVTYRPDLPQDQVDLLAGMARNRKDLLVSRWEDGLPAPLVATAWGRQLRLTTATDPRLAEFVGLYVRQSPEPTAPC